MAWAFKFTILMFRETMHLKTMLRDHVHVVTRSNCELRVVEHGMQAAVKVYHSPGLINEAAIALPAGAAAIASTSLSAAALAAAF